MSEAFDALGINGPQLIAQVANFFVLLIILRFTLYKPIMGMLDERRQKVAEGLNAAERARAEATNAEAQIKAQIDEARAEGQGIVANAQQVAERLQAESRDQAARDRETAIERARQEIQLERDRAIAELRSEFADVTISAAERVIGQSVDRDAHQRIIEETLAESRISEN